MNQNFKFLEEFDKRMFFCEFTNLQNMNHAIEAFRRAKFKFPGRQLIVTSNKWGFTRYDKETFEK